MTMTAYFVFASCWAVVSASTVLQCTNTIYMR